MSLGAQIFGLYLGKEGKKASQMVDGATFFGTPWSTRRSFNFFMTNLGGFPQYVVGMAFNTNIKKNQLPKFEPLMQKSEYESLCRAFDENKTGMDHIDEHVYCKMFGYKDPEDYRRKISIDQIASNISVPVFALDADDDPLVGG